MSIPDSLGDYSNVLAMLFYTTHADILRLCRLTSRRDMMTNPDAPDYRLWATLAFERTLCDTVMISQTLA